MFNYKKFFIHILFLSFKSRICRCEDNSHLRGAKGLANHEGDHFVQLGEESSHRQRVLLIAGPHKTGSSSIQNNMYNWLVAHESNENNGELNERKTMEKSGNVIDNDSRHPHFQNWSWPAPNEIFEYSFSGEKKHMHAKIFYPFGEALRGCRIQERGELKDRLSCNKLLKLCRDKFKEHWKQGYNLAIGTEAFDFVGSNKDPIQIDNLLYQMPWNNKEGGSVIGQNEDITVVLKYRSPRVMHLKSWWHECCMAKSNFADFLRIEMTRFDDRGSRIIDSLQLVERFLDRGLNVVLIDLSGVAAKGYDLSNVIACDVMNIPCTENKIVLGESEPPMIKNKKGGGDMGSITIAQLKEIEKIIKKRDCSFKHLANHEKLKVLYSHDFKTTIEQCNDSGGISREEMNQEILRVMRVDGNVIEDAK